MPAEEPDGTRALSRVAKGEYIRAQGRARYDRYARRDLAVRHCEESFSDKIRAAPSAGGPFSIQLSNVTFYFFFSVRAK